MREIERSDYYTLMYDARLLLAVLRRSQQPFVSIEALDLAFRRIHHACDHYVKPHSVVLIDSRLGPARNDPEFEAAFARHRQTFNKGFRKIAVIIGTAVGKLQLTRLANEDGFDYAGFSDLAEALEYLELPTGTVIAL